MSERSRLLLNREAKQIVRPSVSQINEVSSDAGNQKVRQEEA